MGRGGKATIIISDGQTDSAAATAPPPLISGDK